MNKKTRKYTFEPDVYKSTLMPRMQMTGRDQEVEGGLIVLWNACNTKEYNQINHEGALYIRHFVCLVYPITQNQI